jgi:hypothetical protein
MSVQIFAMQRGVWKCQRDGVTLVMIVRVLASTGIERICHMVTDLCAIERLAEASTFGGSGGFPP